MDAGFVWILIIIIGAVIWVAKWYYDAEEKDEQKRSSRQYQEDEEQRQQMERTKYERRIAPGFLSDKERDDVAKQFLGQYHDPDLTRMYANSERRRLASELEKEWGQSWQAHCEFIERKLAEIEAWEERVRQMEAEEREVRASPSIEHPTDTQDILLEEYFSEPDGNLAASRRRLTGLEQRVLLQKLAWPGKGVDWCLG